MVVGEISSILRVNAPLQLRALTPLRQASRQLQAVVRVRAAVIKVYGLGILVEILCDVLTGTITALIANQEPRGHLFGAINPTAFRPAAEFKTDMDRLIRELKSTPPVEGESQVYVAGEIEFETAEERSERGIPLHSSVLKGLRDVGAQLAVGYDLEN